MVEKSPVGILKLSMPVRIGEERGRCVTLLTVACKQSEIGTITAQFVHWNPSLERMDIASVFTITVRDYHHGRS
jgi:hypothetical protein